MSIRDEYASLDAVGLAERVRSGDVKPTELLEAAIERAEQVNPTINAIVIPMYDEARREAQQGPPDGPFHGVPFLLKDLHLLYTGARTTYGSRLFSDHVADHDSELTARYRRAGLVVFGKSASPEFGITPPRAGRPRRWPPASCPRPTPATAGARSGFPPPAAASSA
jgi:Asp-tRNA(Asn)/Glu-tRNA(Gln) amidotransferase A subunit family amidase